MTTEDVAAMLHAMNVPPLSARAADLRADVWLAAASLARDAGVTIKDVRLSWRGNEPELTVPGSDEYGG